MEIQLELIAAELQLADVVQLGCGPYGTATVKQIRNEEVTFFRPYVHTEEFSYVGGVICTIGIEEFSVPFSNHRYKVLERKKLK